MGKEGRQEGPLIWQLLAAPVCSGVVSLLLRRESDFQGCSLSWSWASAGLSPWSEGFLMERPLPAHGGTVLCVRHQCHLVSPVTALRVEAPSLLGVQPGPPSPTSHHHHASQIQKGLST